MSATLRSGCAPATIAHLLDRASLTPWLAARLAPAGDAVAVDILRGALRYTRDRRGFDITYEVRVAGCAERTWVRVGLHGPVPAASLATARVETSPDDPLWRIGANIACGTAPRFAGADGSAPQVTCVGHRFGSRAVWMIAGERGPQAAFKARRRPPPLAVFDTPEASLPPVLDGGVADGVAWSLSAWSPATSLHEHLQTADRGVKTGSGDDANTAILRQCGRGLALFQRHAHLDAVRVADRGLGTLAGEAHTALALATAVVPGLVAEAPAALAALTAALDAEPETHRRTVVHGDFHDKQILAGDAHTVLLDTDGAGFGDPATDAGNLIAHLVLRAAQSDRAFAWTQAAAFCDGLRELDADVEIARVALAARATLLRLAALYAVRLDGPPCVPALLAAERQLDKELSW